MAQQESTNGHADFSEMLEKASEIDVGDVEERLREKAQPRLSNAEYRTQMISFLYGELHPKYGISRAQAEEIADRFR